VIRKGSLTSGASPVMAGSTTSRQTLVFDRIVASLAEEIDPRRLRHQSANAFVLASAREIKASRPPSDFPQFRHLYNPRHRASRRIDGLTLEDAFDQLAAARHTEDFWQWPRRRIAEESLRSARRKNQHAMSRLAAKHFLPGESDDIELRPIESLGKGGGSCIADRQALAVGSDPIAHWGHARQTSFHSR